MESPYSHYYWQYLEATCSQINSSSFQLLQNILQNTNWDEPTSALDLNNYAVIAFLEAENADDPSAKSFYIETALEALNRGVELDNHPLCTAHLALFLAITGETKQAIAAAFSNFISTLQPAFNSAEKFAPGIVYLPSSIKGVKQDLSEKLLPIIQSQDGYLQSLLLSSEVLSQAQPIFYNETGLRLSNLIVQIWSQSASANLRLGLASLSNNQWEGLLYLHRARQLAPNASSILQALYIAYKDLAQSEIAQFWLNTAREYYEKNPDLPTWQWTQLPEDSPFLYAEFEADLSVAVEASCRSIVTTVLLAEGDWFEQEMELWRNWLKPGMTVIDVGANVGVYTFSAARRVGPQGRVFAVEPFPGCVRCLEETCHINQLSWVKVCAGAASDRTYTSRLSIHAASELNEIMTSDGEGLDASVEVDCFPLDSLIESENIQRVDFLKIDAEGHEMQVLAGSDRILKEFSPTILYENIAGIKGSNLAVAEFLKARDYSLFRYQPFLQNLLPVDTVEDLDGSLNIVALPAARVTTPNA